MATKVIYKAVTLSSKLKSSLIATRYVIFIEEKQRYAIIEFKNNSRELIKDITCKINQVDAKGKVLETDNILFTKQYAKPGEYFGKAKQMPLRPNCEAIEIIEIKQAAPVKKTRAKVADATKKFTAFSATLTVFLVLLTGVFIAMYLPMYQQMQIWLGNNVGTNDLYPGVTLVEESVGKIYIQSVNKDTTSIAFTQDRTFNLSGIKKGAFNQSNVKSISVYHLDEVEAGAIVSCPSLYTVDIEAKKINSSAIVSCSSLVEAILETKTINANTVSFCQGLKTVQLYGAETVKSSAFSGCYQVRTVRLYKSKPKIESGAFENVDQITFYYEGQVIPYSDLVV